MFVWKYFFIELYKYLYCFHTCCMDLHVCLYEYQSFSQSFIYVFVSFHTFCTNLHACLYEYQSSLALIYIHVCIVSILVAWIYMYVCMNIKSSHIDLYYTCLCCFHNLCIHLHVCLYDIDLYTCLCCFHTCSMNLHVWLYEYQ